MSKRRREKAASSWAATVHSYWPTGRERCTSGWTVPSSSGSPAPRRRAKLIWNGLPQRQKREDQIRADMSIEFYGWDPREVDRYHLVVNTGLMDLDTCADIIVQVARAKAGRQGPSP
jgi:hypothetical protein